MMFIARRCTILLIASVLLLIASDARAVLLYSTPERNIEAPGSLGNRDTNLGPAGAGDPRRLLDSGWQYQASFQGFLATPISSQFFVAARHIGGGVGNSISINGSTYTTTAFWDHRVNPNDANSTLLSDLRIYKIDGAFSSWAPMYDANIDGSEVGKSMVVFGRGTQRGAAVTVSGQLKGWEWGAGDGVQSWGENVVTGTANFAAGGDNKLLYFDFDANAGPNEGGLSVGDSSGGVFINANGTWKLAGLNYAVDGPFRYTANGADFNATLFDASGLYYQVGVNDWQLAGPGSIASSYATRISAELSWINSIIGANATVPVPEPTTVSLGLIAAAALLARRPAHSRR